MLGSILGAVGGIASSILGSNAADKQADLQKKFAQKGIQWKVADAKAAGVHPLYALGANTVSYSPVSVGMPDLSAMGQDIGGAIDRVSSAPERIGRAALSGVALEGAKLNNDLVRANIAKTVAETGAISSPSMPHVVEAPGMKAGPFTIGDAKINVPAVTSAQTWQDFGGEMGEWFGGINNLDKMLAANPQLVFNPRMLPKVYRKPNTGFPRYGGIR